MQDPYEFIEIESDPKLKAIWEKDVGSKACANFVADSCFMVLKDWAYRAEQLKSLTGQKGGILMGVELASNFEQDFLIMMGQRAIDAKINILEDNPSPLYNNISFKWKLIKIPRILRDIFLFKNSGEGIFAAMSKKTFAEIRKFVNEGTGRYFQYDHELFFCICSPIDAFSMSDVVCKTNLGIPIVFNEHIKVGNLFVNVLIDNSLASGVVVDLMDYLVDLT